MNRNKALAALLATAVIAGCSSGDININPTTLVENSNNTTNNSSGGSVNDICASYVKDGQTVQGQADGNGNCTYGPEFVGPKNNLTVDLIIPALPNGGAHIFTASLFVGNTYRSNADLQAAGITKGGDGPTLTVQAGATLAFNTNKDFIIINRGSRILANGTADAPITITSVSDINGTAGPESVQQWGGIVINGFGVSNKCSYVGTRGQAGFSLDPANPECHIEAEGSAGDDESQYGGDNDADDSGILRYVVVKHTGAEVANGDELNGISFGAVGSGTVIDNLEVYSTYDDGVEFFGGAVNINNLVAVYARDDSIDIDEGYSGTISNALVIQSETDGNHCIEADGLGSYSDLDQPTKDDFIARGLNSRPTINKLTCIVSGNINGTHDPGAGWRLREGIWATINDSLLISSFEPSDGTASDDNYCLRIDNAETQAAAEAGNLVMNSVIFSCGEPVKGNAFPSGGTELDLALAQGNQFATVAAGGCLNPTVNVDTGLQLVDGPVPAFSLEHADSLVDGAAPLASTTPTSGTYLGGVQLAGTDWTAPWAFGISPDNRGQALWIEAPTGCP